MKIPYENEQDENWIQLKKFFVDLIKNFESVHHFWAQFQQYFSENGLNEMSIMRNINVTTRKKKKTKKNFV